MARLAVVVVLGMFIWVGVAWATPTPTRTPYTAGDMFIDDFVGGTKTPTVLTLSPTPTGTPTPTATPTPTIGGCQIIQLVGALYDVSGAPAANRRVSLQVPYTETPNFGCTIHPSIRTYLTDSNGVLPADATAVGGSVVNVTLENGTQNRVTVPYTTPVNLYDLINHP